MWITLWIDVDKPWISCDSHAIQLNFSRIVLCPLGVSRPLCTQNSQNQHFLPDFVDKSADIVRLLLLCTRLCTMFDISRRACQRSPLTNPVDERGMIMRLCCSLAPLLLPELSCPSGVSRPLCTQNSQDQHFLPDSVDKSADTVRFLLLCTRLCTMFDISRRACQRSPLTNPVDERGMIMRLCCSLVPLLLPELSCPSAQCRRTPFPARRL